MVQGLTNAVRAAELRRRIVFTLVMFAIFRLGIFVPTPGVDAARVSQLLSNGTLFGLLNLFSGGAFFDFSIFAMGIFPYINASIIMQLLTVVVPKVEEWSKEGAEGQKKISQWTRYGTAVLGFLQALGVTTSLGRSGALYHYSLPSILLICLTLTAGTMFLMWLGELITERGIGNGISLIIFAGIVAGLPGGIGNLSRYLAAGTVTVGNLLLLIVIGIVVIAGVIFVIQGERRVPVQYAKRVVGRRVYGGQSSHIPLKVNAAGVIPVIFAISILYLPITILSFWHTPFLITLSHYIGPAGPINVLLEFVLVVVFTFFYTQVIFKPDDVADNMKKYGGFIPGIRPGRPTAQYLGKVSNRITVIGAIFLGVVAILPTFVQNATSIPGLYFGGTALLIVVGVALDTMKQIQAHLVMRNYQGFLK